MNFEKKTQEKQSEIFTEAATLEEMKKILLEQTSDSDNIIKYCEDFVDEFRASKSGEQQEQQLTFVVGFLAFQSDVVSIT